MRAFSHGTGLAAMKMNIRILPLFLFLLVTILFGNQAVAETTPKKISTSELPIASEFQPNIGVHYYDLMLDGVVVGKATISVRDDNDLYAIEVRAKTRRSISALYKVRYKGEVTVQPYPLKPVAASIEEQTGRKGKQVAIDFQEENKVEVTETRLKKGKTVNTQDYFFESESFILDPFSTLFLVQSLDWDVGMAEVFEIVTGKRHYELRLNCDRETTLEIGGESRDVWVISPRAVSISGKDKQPKMTSYEVFLSQDSAREILLISGKIKMGRVEAKKRKFELFPEG